MKTWTSYNNGNYLLAQDEVVYSMTNSYEISKYLGSKNFTSSCQMLEKEQIQFLQLKFGR